MPSPVLRLSLVFCGLFFLNVSAAQAGCDPRLTNCTGQPCDQVGVTTIEKDHTALLVCLAADATQKSFIWKSMTQGVATNGIVAFNARACPSGWTQFAAGNGRAIVGAGSGNTDMNGNALTSRAAGSYGGEEKHKVMISEMPSHQHDSAWGECAGGPFGVDSAFPRNQFGSNRSDYNNYLFLTSAVGGDQAHNTMMPYYSLVFCVKNN